MECMECLNEAAKKKKKKKKGHFQYMRGGYAKNASGTKSLDSRYAHYVSNGDVIETNI